MAGKNTLRARLELLGGKEIVGQFAAIEKSAKKGFDTIEREAKEATRDVKELERELAKLEAMSKSIRASIKVKKGGSLTAEQQQALALARQLDNQAASMRQQIQAANDSLKMGGGNALRTLAGSADKDLLGVAKSASEIDDAVASLRKNGGLGGLISDDQIDKMSAISDALNSENVRYGDNLQNRVSRADATDIEKERRRAENERKDDERFAKRQKAISEAKARERTTDDEREKERQRIREEKQAEQLKKLDDKLTQQRIANEQHLAKIKAENRRREAEAAQRDLDRRQAQSRMAISRQIEQEQVAARNRRQAPIDLPEELQVRRDARLRIEAQRRASQVKDAMGLMAPDEIEKSATAIGNWVKKAEGLEKAGGGFKATGRLITGTAGDIATSLSRSSGSVGKFVSALEGLSTAVGSAALRTGIAGLLGALAGGLAALGGGAVLAGIAAISGLAGWDATKIANAGKSVGTSLESFSTLRYGAQASGVEFDDYAGALKALRATMVSSITKDEDGKTQGGVLWKGSGRLSGLEVNALNADGTTLRDTADVLKEIADIYNRFPNQDLKNSFLDQFGGDQNELRNLIGFLDKGSKGMTELQQEARKLGLELDQKLVDDMEVLNREVFKLLNVFRGIAYSIAREVLPVLKPVMDAINSYLIEHRDDIAQGVVGAWNYLIQTVKDFWKLWNTGGEGGVVQEWTKTVYNGVQRVGDIFGWVWDQIKNGYALAEPTLTMISDYFGLDGPLEVALILAAGWALGFFEVFTKGGKTVKAGMGVALSAIDTLISPLKRIALLALGVVGWPFLLGAGLFAVYAYWDEIEQIFGAAWGKFKETFPQTAAVLEKAFGPALQSVRKFWTDFNGEFASNYPDLKGTLDGMAEAFRRLMAAFTSDEFGLDGMSPFQMMIDFLLKIPIRTLEGLAAIFNTLANAIGVLGAGFGAWDLPEDKLYGPLKQILKLTGSDLDSQLQAAVFAPAAGSTDEALAKSGWVSAPGWLNSMPQPNPLMGIENMRSGYLPPASAASGASAATQGGSSGQPPVVFQINEGPQVTAVITEGKVSDLVSPLSASARARIVK